MKHNALDEMLEILTAGGRLTNERSRALESRRYGDPADHIEFESERKRKQQQQKPYFKIKGR